MAILYILFPAALVVCMPVVTWLCSTLDKQQVQSMLCVMTLKMKTRCDLDSSYNARIPQVLLAGKKGLDNTTRQVCGI